MTVMGDARPEIIKNGPHTVVALMPLPSDALPFHPSLDLRTYVLARNL